MYKVKDHNNLVRDSSNQAVLSADKEKLWEHKSKKQIKDNLDHLNKEIVLLKSDFQEIKFLLQQIASKG